MSEWSCRNCGNTDDTNAWYDWCADCADDPTLVAETLYSDREALRAEKYRLLLLVDTYAESHRAARAETKQEDSER